MKWTHEIHIFELRIATVWLYVIRTEITAIVVLIDDSISHKWISWTFLVERLSLNDSDRQRGKTFLGPVVFWRSAAYLNENTKCRQLINGFHEESCRQRKELKLRANTVNFAFKLGPPSGEFSFHNFCQNQTEVALDVKFKFREGYYKYAQAGGPRKLNVVYERCVLSLKPGSFSVAAALFWGNQHSKYVEAEGLSRTNQCEQFKPNKGDIPTRSEGENFPTYLCRFMQVTLWIQPVSNIPPESFIYSLFFAWIPIVVLHSEGEDAWSFVSSSLQTAHYSTQNESLVPLFVSDVILGLKNPFQGIKITKSEQCREYFTPYCHAKYRSLHRTHRTYLKPLTSYRDVTKKYFRDGIPTTESEPGKKLLATLGNQSNCSLN